MILLSALFGAYLLYLTQKFLYKHYWNKNLQVHIKFSEDYAVEGDDLLLYETVSNKKLLPLPIIKVKFMTSKYLSFLDTNNSNVTDHYYRNDLMSILMYQKLTRSLAFTCTHRGYYIINHMDVVCSDIFISFEVVASFDVDLHLYVYPRPVDYNKFEAPFRKMLGTILTKRFINEDPFEFRSIREYQSYDTIKSVNWKASAKTGSLKVNVFDFTSSQQVKIFINLECETIWKHEDLWEESIRIAATFATAFIEQGIPTAIYTNGLDIITKQLVTIPAGSGMNHIKTLNETLARIDTSLTMPAFVTTVQDEFLSTTENEYILLISSYQKEDLMELLTSQLPIKTEYSWIIPINKNVTINVKEQLSDKIIPWEV